MNRRLFILSGLASSALLSRAGAQAAAPACLVKPDEISAELMGFQRYEHHHTLAIPLSALIKPPTDGITIQTSKLDLGSLDAAALDAFLKSQTRFGPQLRFHSHAVPITSSELDRIARGEKDVVITVRAPSGNVIHTVTFNAPKSALIKIGRARGSKV